MEYNANKTIYPCQEKCDFSNEFTRFALKGTWNDIFSGSWHRLVCAALHSAPAAVTMLLPSDVLRSALRGPESLVRPLTAVALLRHASIIYVHLLRWEQTGDRRQGRAAY